MVKRLRSVGTALLSAGMLFGGLQALRAAAPRQPTAFMALNGELGAHDPSRIVRCNGKYFYYVTGPNIPMRSSTDLKHWTGGPGVLNGVPAWLHTAVPLAHGDFVWAPDVIFLNHRYYLYYAYSTFGSRVSAIGLVTSPTLDPTAPGYHWTDAGEVIASTRESAYNAIDPCPVLDAKGNLWLAFGSWNRGGIQIVPLDKTTGKPTGSPQAIVAGQRTGPEASFVWPHGGYYYVFENEGLCCQGMNSTYRIMMGRSRSIAGPYLDKAGRDLAQGGGTLFLGTDGTMFGPGQVGVFPQGGTDYLGIHYYDGVAGGRPTFGLSRLNWARDGWPLPPAALIVSNTLDGHYRLVNKATGRTLSAQASDKDGTPVGQSPGTGTSPTPWNVSPTGDGSFAIASLANGKFLDLDHCNATDGTTIEQYPWLNNDCQRWRIEPNGDGTYRIISKSSGSAVTASNVPATPIQQRAWRSDDTQKWYFRRD